jgi:hypothetical protein
MQQSSYVQQGWPSFEQRQLIPSQFALQHSELALHPTS